MDDVETLTHGVLDPQDDAVLRAVALLYDTTDPVPPDLADRLTWAVALHELHAEVAELSRFADQSMAVRGEQSERSTETLTFSTAELTVMISISRSGDRQVRLDGWVAPAEPLRIELRREGRAGPSAEADQDGRFVMDEVARGLVQLSFRRVPDGLLEQGLDAAAVVVTPVFEL